MLLNSANANAGATVLSEVRPGASSPSPPAHLIVPGAHGQHPLPPRAAPQGRTGHKLQRVQVCIWK